VQLAFALIGIAVSVELVAAAGTVVPICAGAVTKDLALLEIRPQDNLVRSVSAAPGFTLAARIFAVAAAVNDGGEGQSKSKNGGELHGCNLCCRVVMD